MADRNAKHPWGTCDGCGVDLGGVCCYSPHQFGDYDTLCHLCFTSMKREREERIARATERTIADANHRYHEDSLEREARGDNAK